MYLKLFNGKLFSVYGLLGAAGFVLGIIFTVIACRKKRVRTEDAIYVYAWAAVLAIVGAKALYLLLDIKKIIHAFAAGGEQLKAYLAAAFGGGLVFYGGLGGALLGVFLATKFFRLDFRTMLTVLIPALPLAHAFGRIGCHTVGCCYGIEVHGHFGKVYTDSLFAPNNVRLFPVQLTESICDMAIFVFLAVMLFKTPKDRLSKSRIPEAYLISYAAVRFVLEYLRGDLVRGHFLAFSTSQWISLIIMGATVVSLIIGKKKKNPVT